MGLGVRRVYTAVYVTALILEQRGYEARIRVTNLGLNNAASVETIEARAERTRQVRHRVSAPLIPRFEDCCTGI